MQERNPEKFDFRCHIDEKFGRDFLNEEIDCKFNLEEKNCWNINKINPIRDEIRKNNRDNFPDKQVFILPRVEILPGNIDALQRLAESEPQRDEEGNLRYLLTSGLAVEVITGFKRPHHDIDLVIQDKRGLWWMKYGTDNVTAEQYWAEMIFDPGYLEKTAWTTECGVNGKRKQVLSVHPAIILVQKLSNAWGRPPRERDVKDVEALMSFWQETLNADPSWEPVMEKAITTLPKGERERTRARLSGVMKVRV